ncbi:hypothetical protein BJ742DRAFT_790103 [Cladochytrium replicatum]|nr:hypothetical protein BJ742DRAFT_790103 [Cladochytrium replicatum]
MSTTITLRLVRSFDYRTVRNLVLHDVDLAATTPRVLHDLVISKITSASGWKPFISVNYGKFTTRRRPAPV